MTRLPALRAAAGQTTRPTRRPTLPATANPATGQGCLTTPVSRTTPSPPPDAFRTALDTAPTEPPSPSPELVLARLSQYDHDLAAFYQTRQGDALEARYRGQRVWTEFDRALQAFRSNLDAAAQEQNALSQLGAGDSNKPIIADSLSALLAAATRQQERLEHLQAIMLEPFHEGAALSTWPAPGPYAESWTTGGTLKAGAIAAVAGPHAIPLPAPTGFAPPPAETPLPAEDSPFPEVQALKSLTS